MPEEAPRRFLIATGVTVSLPKTGDRIAESVDMMSALFQKKFGYERATSLGLNPSAKEMQDELRDFAKKCNPEDIVALYYTGHGDVVNSRHRLWMGDNTGDRLTGTLPTSELAERMLTDTSLSKLLIILDVCFAGQGGAEALLTGMQVEGGPTGKILVAITAAHPREQVLAGDFARLFVRSVDDPATAGHEPQYLTLDAILRHIESDPERKEWQTVSYNTLFLTHDPGFFPNPRYDTVFHGYDLATQLQMEQDDQRREDLEKFFNPRARGVDVPQEAGWNFVGRHAALRDITAWLVDPSDQRTIAVTGDPGSGKSAVIGRLYVLSLPDWGKAVPRQGLPGDTIPPTGCISVAIRASNRTSKEILSALCSAARVTARTPGEFLRAMTDKPMVAAIDAIDEAVDPYELVTAILNPLVEGGPKAGFRMLLGARSRSYSLDLLSPKADRLDLDDERYADPESMCLYAEARLHAADASPYATADAATVRAVAEAIAETAGRSFLVTLITSRTQAARKAIADPTDQAWRDSLPGTAAEAMQQDLEARLGADAARARDLLRPLAYARGNGLPWEDLWAPLASLLAGKEYRDEDLIWLRQQAGSYVLEALESGRSVYQLYHAALAEYLRQGQDERHLNSEFARFLLGRVPRAGTGEREWHEAHPYILSHLSTHAAAAGELGMLTLDPGYLACAAPPGLLAAFTTVQDTDTRLVATAYERAMHQLRSNDLADRLSYLELAAQRARAMALAERIKSYPLQRRWSVIWIQWPPDHPHRVLAGHRGPVNEVVGISTQDRAVQAASVGHDGTLRLWDLGTAEPLGVHQVSRAALTAIDLVELPGPQRLAVVLSADGFLTTHELPSISDVLKVPIQSRRRRALQRLVYGPPEMRSVALPDGRHAAATGGRGVMATIWDIQTGTPIVKLPVGLRPASVEFWKLASGDPIVASIGPIGSEQSFEQLFDLATGRRIPHVRTVLRRPKYRYYYRRNGLTPVIALRDDYVLLRDIVLRRDQPRIFDLTGPPASGTRRIPTPYRNTPIRLNDGSFITLECDKASLTWLPVKGTQGDEGLVELSDIMLDFDGGSSRGIGSTIHVKTSENFPFRVTLDGRLIMLSPIQAVASNRQRVELRGHSSRVTDADVVAAPGEPPVLVSSSVDGTVRDWDISSDIEAAPDSSQAGDQLSAMTSVAETTIDEGVSLGVAIAIAEEKPIAVIDLNTGSTIARLNRRSGEVWAATCGWVPAVGHAAITFDVGGMVDLWRLPSGDHVASFEIYTDRMPTKAVFVPLPGYPLVLTCGHGDKAVTWDLVDQRIHDVLGRHTGWIGALACGANSDGTVVAATGGDDNRVNLWNPMRRRRLSHLKIVTRMNYLRDPDSGHATAVSLVTIGDRRDVILVLCRDGKLRLFEKRRWRPGYRGAVLGGSAASCLAVMRLSDGRTVAVTGGQNGRLQAWDVEVALAAGKHLDRVSTLIDIEIEADITGLCVAGNETIVTSTLNGLAAFRLHAESLPS